MPSHRAEMYTIYHGETVIGHSSLESGDPPMGVASGIFEPTAEFAELRDQSRPVVDGAGHPISDMRAWVGLSLRTPAGVAVECVSVDVVEAGPKLIGLDFPQPSAWRNC